MALVCVVSFDCQDASPKLCQNNAGASHGLLRLYSVMFHASGEREIPRRPSAGQLCSLRIRTKITLIIITRLFGHSII